ncbi:hypothetical protein NPIL_521011 [Nephila pilipes]|uniref:Uncharacterized protein n=1 Tax=Nephila pilipes TaxID=299642 RepID=A0A8X6TI66_NEPPI|nr:hypothetical protein NPIL_521011 [Nephila pilipes]
MGLRRTSDKKHARCDLFEMPPPPAEFTPRGDGSFKFGWAEGKSPVRWPQAERRDPLKVLSSDSCRCSLANSGGYSPVRWAPHDACQPRVPRPETVNFSKESRSLRVGQR